MKLRVLVADDSLTVRRHLCDILGGQPDIEVVGEAEDGQRAFELCAARRPHVVTMDMMMPVMTGLAATEHIMAHCPTPILIVSSSTNRGELFHTYDALAAGAVDVIEKPRSTEASGAWERQFLSTVRLVSRIRVITHPRAKLPAIAGPARPHSMTRPPRASTEIIALGASTGGPAALVQVLRAIPAPCAKPIVLVIHINEPFGNAFADWLDGQTGHRVTLARDGVPLAGVVMAPPSRHLVVERGIARLSNAPERFSCRPSVDILFESVARSYGADSAASLLTGMGRDGATGLLAIRASGGHTIAQDEPSSTVFGMPREAIAIGAALQVLPLGEIGGVLAALVGGAR